MKRLSAAFAVLLTGGVLAGCTAITMDPVTIEPSYKVSDLWWAGKDDGLPLSVNGAPYGLSSEEAAASFADHMRVPGYAPQVEIRPRTSADERGGWGVVLAFDTPESTAASEVCGMTRGHDLESVSAADGQSRRIFAAYCRGGSRVTSTRVSLPEGIEGPDDPQLHRSLQDISRALFPRNNPNLDDRDNQGNDWNS
ncbi:hypothetical protein [Fodinicurvata fenggangensis]|uniref:hypothetical protein n=1 Tax=Fodinicurvata fenggangensis TaxID=1121830 RepID=UPI00047AC61D|nr:hypothetical protein [Fodinicurvata fenggangensis]